MNVRFRLVTMQAQLLLRRADRRRRRRLAAELATYTSHAELNDLYALLDTYPDGQTHEIRRLLGAQQQRRMTSVRGPR